MRPTKEQAIRALKNRRATMKALGVRHKRRPMPKQQRPAAIELAYFRTLRPLLERARALVNALVLRTYPELLAEAKAQRGDGIRLDAGKRIQTLMEAVAQAYAREVTPAELARIGAEYAKRTSGFQRDQLFKQLKAQLGIEGPLFEKGLQARIADFTAQNVSLIQSISDKYFGDVESRVIAAVREAKRAEDLAVDLQERFNVAEDHAKLVARDQVGKFYAELNEARQSDLGIDRYVWRSVHDNRVRSAHEEFDGNVYSWDEEGPGDGSAQEGTTPGTAILCRCFADPYLEDILQAL